MLIPKYAKDEVYRELANICEMAGKEIVYRKLDERIAGATDKYNSIEMPDTEIEGFDEFGFPTFVLGHELGHCLCERPSITFVKTFENLMNAAKHYEKVSDFIDNSEELIADLAGEFLSSLAEMIGSHKAEQELERKLASR